MSAIAVILIVALGGAAAWYVVARKGQKRPAHPERKDKPKTRKQILWEYVEIFVTALILALIIRAYVVQAFKIPSESMVPTLLKGDQLLVNKFLYGTALPFTDKRVLVFKKPERNDIIVFKYPEDPARDFIKRVVGVEGDKVEIKDKQVFVNGQKEEQGFARFTDSTVLPRGMGPRDNFGPVTVPPGKLFVMGDNRDNSHDSRFWGFVDITEVKGKAFVIYWSWDWDSNVPRFRRLGNIVK